MERIPSPGPVSKISEPTLRRLPGYYRYFRDLQNAGAQLVSCAMVGRDLSVDPTLVRKDLESIAAVGRRRVGFVLSDLVRGIETSLGYNGVNRAFLMGAGNLGTALLGYKKFREYGLQIVAVFDAAPSRVGERLHDLEVQPLDRLTEFAREWNAQIGIVTVPVAEAQKAVDLLVANGIHAIWNFAPVRVQVPPDVIVQSEDLYRSLATLSYKLVMKQQGDLSRSPKPAADPAEDCSA
jgi:redox-sensing transcriptional repressor